MGDVSSGNLTLAGENAQHVTSLSSDAHSVHQLPMMVISPASILSQTGVDGMRKRQRRPMLHCTATLEPYRVQQAIAR